MKFYLATYPRRGRAWSHMVVVDHPREIPGVLAGLGVARAVVREFFPLPARRLVKAKRRDARPVSRPPRA